MPFTKGYTPFFKGKEMRPISERLLEKKEVLPNGCWYFTGCKDFEGYGLIHFKKRQERTHRISAYLFKHFNLKGKTKVLHSCDNRACFNPKHLWFGTQADNVRDMDRKGRRNKTYLLGEGNGRSKLTKEQVLDIIKQRKKEVPIKQICLQYKIHDITVWRICFKHNWKHIHK